MFPLVGGSLPQSHQTQKLEKVLTNQHYFRITLMSFPIYQLPMNKFTLKEHSLKHNSLDLIVVI